MLPDGELAMLNAIIFWLPAVMAIQQFIVAGCFLIKRDYSWAIIWGCYATANVAFALVGSRE